MGNNPDRHKSAVSRAYALGAASRAATIAAWMRTLVDWNVSLERAAEMIEAGVPWHSSEQFAEHARFGVVDNSFLGHACKGEDCPECKRDDWFPDAP